MISAQALLAGKVTQSAAADNATATATVSAIAGQTHFMLGISADYNVALNAIQTITIIQGSTTILVFEWDFNNGAFHFAFPAALKGVLGGAVSATLQASGAGSTFGRISLYHFEN